MVYISILLILKQDRLAKSKNPQRRSLSVISVLLRIQMYSHIQESGHQCRFADKLHAISCIRLLQEKSSLWKRSLKYIVVSVIFSAYCCYGGSSFHESR